MWWHDPSAVGRYVADLLSAELARIAPGRPLPPRPWPPQLTLDERGLGCDSLDRLKLSVALGDAVHLAQSGIEDTLLAQTTLDGWLQTVARALDARADRFTFKTSGSTGAPAWCVHERAELEAEIAELAPRFTSVRRVVGVVPAHHIYGFLWTLMLPQTLGVPFADLRAASPPGAIAQLRAGDLVIGHPVFWSACAAAGSAVVPGVAGVTSTGPLEADVARRLIELGLERLIDVFGSSETAGIGRREDPESAYELLSRWERGESDELLVRRRADGKTAVYRLPDRLDWQDGRRFFPAGRREGAIQVGGHNVFPAVVREALREHPGVADAAVRLMLPHEGDRLKAFIVPRDAGADHAALRGDLYRWFDERLTPPERPRALTFGARLPTGPMGKSGDWPAGGDP